MRKQIIGGEVVGHEPSAGGIASAKWLDLDAVASVEVSSEDPEFPIEEALGSHPESKLERGWRAAGPGPQTIRLRFDSPQHIQRIFIRFIDRKQERGQEFLLRYTASGRTGDIVRQQWSFSPGGSTEELEDYAVDLPGVAVLELQIDPDRGAGKAVAVLSEFHLA
ncbi:MAG TPA: hypothetical protein VGD59_12580 [Acidisarcina sp.]